MVRRKAAPALLLSRLQQHRIARSALSRLPRSQRILAFLLHYVPHASRRALALYRSAKVVATIASINNISWQSASAISIKGGRTDEYRGTALRLSRLFTCALHGSSASF